MRRLRPPAGHRQVPRRVVFLMNNAHGAGGVAATTIALANRLAETHEVEVISIVAHRRRPRFRLDPRVTLSWILDDDDDVTTDTRPANDPQAPERLRRLDSQPSVLDESRAVAADRLSALTDRRLARRLARLPPCILISTRPTLHRAASRWTPPWVVRIGVEHSGHAVRVGAPSMTVIKDAARRLDALVALTDSDAEAWREEWRGDDRAPRVVTISNPSAHRLGRAAPLTEKVVVTAGRLEPNKGIDRVIAGFAQAAEGLPDWRLRVFGAGVQRQELLELAADLGVADRVELCGYTRRLRRELRAASVFALGSHREGQSLVLLEAASAGLPMVAYDVPVGPASVIDDGANGRLVPDGDTATYAHALRELMLDEGVRTKLGAGARATGRTYSMTWIADRWMELFDELAAGRRLWRPRRSLRVRSPRR